LPSSSSSSCSSSSSSSSSTSSSVGTTTLSWVSTCSTFVEHSQQEGFTECLCQLHVKPPAWRTRDLERSNFRHKRSPASEATLANPAAEGGTMGEKFPFALSSLKYIPPFKYFWTAFYNELILLSNGTIELSPFVSLLI
jgi:hypothetical protein